MKCMVVLGVHSVNVCGNNSMDLCMGHLRTLEPLIVGTGMANVGMASSEVELGQQHDQQATHVASEGGYESVAWRVLSARRHGRP